MFKAPERLKLAQNPTTPVETLKKLAALVLCQATIDRKRRENRSSTN